MDLFRIINDIAAEARMTMAEKVCMLIRILVRSSPKRIECRRRPGPEAGDSPGAWGPEAAKERGAAGPASTPRQDTQ